MPLSRQSKESGNDVFGTLRFLKVSFFIKYAIDILMEYTQKIC